MQDLTLAIVNWGICLDECPADINGDNRVNVQDLTEIIINWGVCATD